MRRSRTIAIIIGAVVLIGGGIILTVNLLGQNKASNDAYSKLVDPDGVYSLFSDPSITTQPEENAVFGNGQSLAFEYDGSKTNNDENAALSYQLYYIKDDGTVQPLGGGNLNGVGSGRFTTSTKIFDPAASGASGFFELIGTYGADGETLGKTARLGMYTVKFEVAE